MGDLVEDAPDACRAELELAMPFLTAAPMAAFPAAALVFRSRRRLLEAGPPNPVPDDLAVVFAPVVGGEQS